MIYKNGKLVKIINQTLLDENKKIITKAIGKIYKGTKLVWVTVYNAVKSCFSSGTWLSDKNWTNDDTWKNN